MKHIFLTISFITLSVSLVCAKQYPDEVREASAMESRIRQGWNIEMSGGVGAGEFGFQQIGQKTDMQHVGNSLAFPAWNAAIGLNYYFVNWFGLGTGVQMSSYSNVSKAVTPWTYHHVDPSGEGYTFTATPNNLTETQNMAFLEVPLALKFRAIPDKVGFVGTLGMKFAFPMYNSYKLAQGGFIANQVSYESGKTLPLGNSIIAPTDGKLASSALNRLNYVGYAEIGLLFRLHQRVDMNVSLYGSYYISNVMTDATRTSFGFADRYEKSQYPIPFKTSYAGVLTTNEVKELHPWSAGLRIGFQFNLSRTKAQRDYDKQQRKLDKVEPQPKDSLIDKQQCKLDKVEPQPKDSLMDHIKNIERKLNSMDSLRYLVVRDTVYLPGPQAQNNTVQTFSTGNMVADSRNSGQAVSYSPMPVLTTVRVARGNRLAQFARRYYKESECWVFIYEANQDKLTSPHKLLVGMQLDIPDLSLLIGSKTKKEVLDMANDLKKKLNVSNRP